MKKAVLSILPAVVLAVAFLIPSGVEAELVPGTPGCLTQNQRASIQVGIYQDSYILQTLYAQLSDLQDALASTQDPYLRDLLLYQISFTYQQIQYYEEEIAYLEFLLGLPTCGWG
jgi:hypothetical protein